MQNVLVIDDSEFDRRMIVSAMKKTCDGVRCVELSHGENVLEVMRSAAPSITIVDIRMPGMSGWDVLDKIKADETLCDFNVVMMSGSHSEEDVSLASKKGANGFYTKPHKQSDYRLVATEIRDMYFNTAA